MEVNDFQVSHVRREGNEVAGTLSKWALSFNDERRSRVNTNIVTMVVAWGMNLGEREEVVNWVMHSCFEDEWLLVSQTVMEWMVPGASFDLREGVVNKEVDELWELFPFIYWPIGFNRDARRVEVEIGWNALKSFLHGKVDGKNAGSEERRQGLAEMKSQLKLKDVAVASKTTNDGGGCRDNG
ncbi:hypothetical protein SUGI_0055230 [Cryptomeria japonica]|nr:hypothetical protein SUGI_0055230 [Cryptomeria japonica]